MIRQAGYNEPRYTAEQKRLTLRRELAETVGGDLTLPKSYSDAYNRFENEQRAIDYVTLDRAKAGDIAAPAPEVPAELVADKGYHSRDGLKVLDYGPWKTRIAERRTNGILRWHGDNDARRAV